MSTQKSKLAASEHEDHPESGQRPAFRQHSLADAESARSEASGFSGTCENASLADWIQFVQMGRRDAVIGVRTHDGRKGLLWCRDGDIIDAWCDGLTGEDAAYRTLAWEGGRISVAFATFEHPRRIQIGTTTLLLRSAYRKDSGVRSIQPPPSFASSAPTPPATANDSADMTKPASPPRKRQRHRRALVLGAAALGLLAVLSFGVALTQTSLEMTQKPRQPTTLLRTEVDAARTLPASQARPPSAAPGAPDVTPPTTTAPSPPPPSLVRSAPGPRRAVASAPAKPATTPASEPAPARRSLKPTKATPDLAVIDERTPQVRIIDERDSQIEVIE